MYQSRGNSTNTEFYNGSNQPHEFEQDEQRIYGIWFFMERMDFWYTSRDNIPMLFLWKWCSTTWTSPHNNIETYMDAMLSAFAGTIQI